MCKGTYMKHERLKILVDNHEKNQTQIAADLDLSQQRFNTYVNGLRDPDDDTLVNIADYFETTTDYLLGRDVEIETVAAHHDGEEWTEEELEDIEKFKEYIRSKRENKGD